MKSSDLNGRKGIPESATCEPIMNPSRKIGLHLAWFVACVAAMPAMGQQSILESLRKQAEKAVTETVRTATLPRSLGGDFIDFDSIVDFSSSFSTAGDTAAIAKTGRGQVLVIHPDRRGPAVVKRAVAVEKDQTSLDFSIRGHPSGDVVVRVIVAMPDGREEMIWQATVVGRGGWIGQSLNLGRYHGQTISVRLEAHANGWHFEHLGINYFLVVADGNRVPLTQVAVAQQESSKREPPRPTAAGQTPDAASPTATAKPPVGPAAQASTDSVLGAEWYGDWKGPEGSRLEFSPKKLSVSGFRGERGKKKEAYQYEVTWQQGLAYDGKQWTPAALSREYERALQAFKRDPTDFSVSEPVASRRAIQQLAPGTYRVLAESDGPDCNAEYILDRNTVLQIVDCKYTFSVVPFFRMAAGGSTPIAASSTTASPAVAPTFTCGYGKVVYPILARLQKHAEKITKTGQFSGESMFAMDGSFEVNIGYRDQGTKVFAEKISLPEAAGSEFTALQVGTAKSKGGNAGMSMVFIQGNRGRDYCQLLVFLKDGMFTTEVVGYAVQAAEQVNQYKFGKD